MRAFLLFLYFIALAYSDCAQPQCQPDGLCCSDDCTFNTNQCRPSQDDCDAPEFCTGTSTECPPDTPPTHETPVLWDWVGKSGQLKVWVPACGEDEAAAQWLKIKFEKLEEVTATGGKPNGKPASLNNLASQSFTTSILTQDQIDADFSYDPLPRDVAQIQANINVNGAPLVFTLSVMYFDDASSISWSDDGSNTFSIPQNSVKFNVKVEGAWPWSAADNQLKLSMSILWANSNGAPAANDGDNSVSIDISSDLPASIVFPKGNVSPLLVDGKAESVTVAATTSETSIKVAVTFPHFTDSVVYDPYVVMGGLESSVAGIQLGLFALFSAVFLHFL